MFKLGDVFDSKEVVKGEISARHARAICRNGVIKDIGGLNSGREGSVYKRVKVGIEGLKNRDWTLIGNARFVDEGATSEFKRRRENSSGKDKRNEGIKRIRPRRMEASKDVESEAIVSGFGGDSTNDVSKGQDRGMEGSATRRRGRRG